MVQPRLRPGFGTVQRMDFKSFSLGPSLEQQLEDELASAKPVAVSATQRLLETAERFQQRVRLSGHKIYLSGGAAVTLIGGPRPIDDLDFRIICDFTFKDETGKKFIVDLNAILVAKGEALKGIKDRKKRSLDAPFACKDAAGHTVMGAWDGCEISISRTPTVKYVGSRVYEGKGLRIIHLGLPDLIWDKAIAICFRDKVEKQCNDMVDLLFMLSKDGRNGDQYTPHMLRVVEKRGDAFKFKLAVEYQQENASAKDIKGFFVRQLSGAIVAKQVAKAVQKYNLTTVLKHLVAALLEWQ